MDQSDFSVLTGRLEREADERPQLYAARVAVVAALGYLALALLGAIILYACYQVVRSQITEGRPSGWMMVLGAGAVATLIAIVRALWVRLGAPHGRPITAEEAPQLFALIDDVASRIEGPPLATVTINGEFDAGIRQIPRWSVFGGYGNHLEIGLPLMAALSVEEFTAVLAHEMGHVGGRHDRFSAWVYRQRMTWAALQRKFAEPVGLFDRALAPFYSWYAPYFYACSFVLARNHEYAADRAAAHVASPEAVGRALIKRELMSRFLAEVFWERFFSHVEKSAEPPYRPYSVMQRAFTVAEKQWARPDWLRDALARYAADDDTHPSLAERLAALELTPALPSFDESAAALSLLEPAATGLIQHCDDEWRAENLPQWRKRHDEIREARWKISEYEQYDANDLGPEDLWAKAQLLFTVQRYVDGVETLQVLVSRSGSHPQAHMQLGQLLLDNQDERGLEHLAAAAQQDPALVRTAGVVGYSYLVNRGRKREAMRFWERVSAAAETDEREAS
jgi:Zn-dependent protease with chaperone function